jgi:hypothetical protein
VGRVKRNCNSVGKKKFQPPFNKKRNQEALMKHLIGGVLVLVMVLSMFGLVSADEDKPDATLKLSSGQVAVGIGWSWGEGVLTYKEVDYPFKVKGLSVGDVGITKAEAVGSVYSLKELSAFNGTYTSAAAQGTLGGGVGASAMKNQNGVVIQLVTTTQGINVKLAAEGVSFTLK